jgi:CRP-like cAMP-binding protein
MQGRYPGLIMTGPLTGLRTTLEFLAEVTDLPDWEVFAANVRISSIAAKNVLVRQGDYDTCLHFVLKGLVKLSYETREGAALTKSIVAEGASFASLSSLEGRPSTFSAMTLEASMIASIAYPTLQTLMARHHAWERIARKVFAALATKKEQREFELLTMSPQQRWLKFQTENPNLIGRITQIEIAGLIGITPVGLSRIKGRLRPSASLAPNFASQAPSR